MQNDGGQCFQKAFHLREKLGMKAELCQGMVRGGSIPYHCHAWVELDGVCYDDSLGKMIELPTPLYYALGHVKDVYRYSYLETLKWCLDTLHYGPWEGEEACPPLETKSTEGNIL